jgi:hypothetical protein
MLSTHERRCSTQRQRRQAAGHLLAALQAHASPSPAARPPSEGQRVPAGPAGQLPVADSIAAERCAAARSMLRRKLRALPADLSSPERMKRSDGGAGAERQGTGARRRGGACAEKKAKTPADAARALERTPAPTGSGASALVRCRRRSLRAKVASNTRRRHAERAVVGVEPCEGKDGAAVRFICHRSAHLEKILISLCAVTARA